MDSEPPPQSGIPPTNQPPKRGIGNPPAISNYERTFEITGYGRCSHMALVSSTFILLHAFIETVGFAYVMTPAECDLGLTVGEKGLVNAASFIGIIVSAICWGSAGDRYGRRKVMIPAVFGAIFFSFISSLCSGFGLLVFFRLITGILISASSATILVYLGELHTSAHRDKALAYAIAAVAAAFCLIPGIAWIIVPGKWEFSMFSLVIKPWRVFMWVWGLIGSIGLVILIILPESPRYIYARKGGEFTLAILAKMYAWNTGKSPSDFPVTSLRCESVLIRPEARGLKHELKLMTELVRPPLLRPTLISHYCLFNVYLTANGLYIWLPDIINEILNDVSRPESICTTIVKKYGDENNGNATKTCQDINTMMYPLSIAVEFFFFLFYVVISYVIVKYDKRILNAAVMTPCAFALALCSVVPQLTVAGLLLSLGIATGSATTLLSALAVDVFPTSLRALAMCTMFMCGQLGGALGANLLAFSLSGCEIVFIFIACNMLVSAGILYKFWPDAVKLRSEMDAKGMTY